ncbi:anti-sigma factor family protein [Calothrix rhizosoleniae]|uniref:anti-sigma factor family protein n=1 Tax=Calothrix rhizosoleniae TaxID=888997 RepID=UPI000B49B2FB|nr:transcriptional regulator [Calothrix rhizosoleniae]
MTTDSQFHNRSSCQNHQDMADRNTTHTNELTGVMDRSKRDRFELLSAYLDGEVTAVERKQVEKWLAEDSTVQGLYARLLKIRQGIHNLPVSRSESSEETVNKVFARIRRKRFAIIGGVAACAITAITGLISGESSIPQIANQKPTEQPQAQTIPKPPSSLKVAINDPIFPIPKAIKRLRPRNGAKVKPIRTYLNSDMIH